MWFELEAGMKHHPTGDNQPMMIDLPLIILAQPNNYLNLSG
jgi:hypothetical protein